MRSLGLRFWVLIFVLTVTVSARKANAGFERRYVGARALGAAGAVGTIGEDCWSFYFNPARSADISEINLFYSPAILGLPELKATGLAVRSDLLGFSLGGGVQSFGCKLYRETVFTLNISRPLADFVFLGCNLNLNHLFIKGYGTDMSESLDLGTKIFLAEHVAISGAVTNLSSTSMTVSNDRLPQTFTFGIGFVSEEVNVEVDYFKELGFPSAVRVAAEYSPTKEFIMRVGTTSGTSSIHAGVGLQVFSLELDYGMAYHQVLGMTHSVGLSFRIGGESRSDFESIESYRESLK